MSKALLFNLFFLNHFANDRMKHEYSSARLIPVVVRPFGKNDSWIISIWTRVRAKSLWSPLILLSLTVSAAESSRSVLGAGPCFMKGQKLHLDVQPLSAVFEFLWQQLCLLFTETRATFGCLLADRRPACCLLLQRKHSWVPSFLCSFLLYGCMHVRVYGAWQRALMIYIDYVTSEPLWLVENTFQAADSAIKCRYPSVPCTYCTVKQQYQTNISSMHLFEDSSLLEPLIHLFAVVLPGVSAQDVFAL